MQFLYSVYYEVTSSVCFKHYLLILRRRYTNSSSYVAYILCMLAASRVGLELQSR
jgi:hypothetical protein